MDAVVILGVIGFTIRLGYKISGLLFLWWRKEYRLDRMIIHLRTIQGKNLLLGKTHLLLGFCTALWFVPFLQSVGMYALSFCAFGLGIIYLRNLRTWPLPAWSPKVVLLFGICTGGTYMAVHYLPLPVPVSLAIWDLVLFPVSVLSVALVSIPTRFYHKMVIARALAVLSSHAPMTVVGITGSYGKTSVKEYLATILSTQFVTLKTEASKNSPIGIAETVMKSRNRQHSVFVVEMGAYKPGEIEEMTAMVKPEIGIVTAINPQHQDLFGNMEKTVQAKYELLAGLTGRKIAIVNLDDDKTRRMGEMAVHQGITVWGWTTGEENEKRNAGYCTKIFRAHHIVSDQSGISFDCVMEKEKERVRAAVLGAHQAANILAAIAGAVACGMKFQSAVEAASSVKPAAKVMEMIPAANGAIYINDTFNNNPAAARAAIAFLGKHTGKRILVFQPMIELGTYAQSAHENVGRFAGQQVDAIILTNANFLDPFKRGVRRGKNTDVPVIVANPKQAATYIRTHVHSGDMVVFKGKDAEHTLNLLMSAPV